MVLGFQKVTLNNYERGSDDILGLTLGLDLQGGSHLIYQAINPETGVPGGVTEEQMASLLRTIERRVNASGLGEVIEISGGTSSNVTFEISSELPLLSARSVASIRTL